MKRIGVILLRRITVAEGRIRCVSFSGYRGQTFFIQVTAMAPGPMWQATLRESGPSISS